MFEPNAILTAICIKTFYQYLYLRKYNYIVKKKPASFSCIQKVKN